MSKIEIFMLKDQTQTYRNQNENRMPDRVWEQTTQTQFDLVCLGCKYVPCQRGFFPGVLLLHACHMHHCMDQD